MLIYEITNIWYCWYISKDGGILDRKAFYKLSYGLYIVSSAFGGKDGGCVVNTLSQVTSEPAKMSVALNKNNFTLEQIEKSGFFSAVALSQDADIKLIGVFGFRSGRDNDKFAGLAFSRDENGMPYINESVVARYSCRIVQKLDVGTHLLLVGEVTEAEIMNDSEPLTYTYYQKVKKGTTPKNAPSYQKPV